MSLPHYQSPLLHRGDSVDWISACTLLSMTVRCLQMGIQITIRGVSEEVRDELAARAALERLSMQEYLRRELERIAARPSVERWLEGVRERKEAAGNRVSACSILAARDAGRG